MLNVLFVIICACRPFLVHGCYRAATSYSGASDGLLDAFCDLLFVFSVFLHVSGLEQPQLPQFCRVLFFKLLPSAFTNPKGSLREIGRVGYLLPLLG